MTLPRRAGEHPQGEDPTGREGHQHLSMQDIPESSSTA